MKSKSIKSLLLVCVITASLGLAACGSTNTSDKADNTNISNNASSEEKAKENSKQSSENMLTIDNPNIKPMLAEIKEHPELEKVIKERLNTTDEKLKQTRYYYNYVDLNGDGVDEIFVELVGSHTSGNGGDTALIYSEENGTLKEIAYFTSIRNPIIISDSMTDGWKNILVRNTTNNSMDDYVILKYNGTTYSGVNNSDILASINNESGIAIIANDTVKDMENGVGLHLVK